MRVILSVLFISVGARADDALTVRAHVNASPKMAVRLSQLVEQPQLLGEDANVTVNPGLAAGATAKISASRLAQYLRPVVIRARGDGRELHLKLPDVTVITAIPHEFNAANVGAELMQGWQAQCGECRFEIENLNLPQILNVREWSIKALPALPRGTFSVALILNRDQGAPTTGWVGGRLIVRRKVPVARRMLQMGDRVIADDFSWEYRDTAQAIDGIPGPTEVAGKKLRRGVANGEVLWQGTLERDRAIHRGEVVQLRAGDKDWEVSLSVVAPQDAFVGDVISFKNAKTNNVVMGQVTGPGQAEIK